MLDTEHFTLLAGRSQGWDKEVVRRTQAGESLIEVQKWQYAHGRLSMQLVECVHGWGVRSATSLMLPYQTGDNNIRMSHLEAIKRGMEWAYEDEVNREFFARTSDLQPGWQEFVKSVSLA